MKWNKNKTKKKVKKKSVISLGEDTSSVRKSQSSTKW